MLKTFQARPHQNLLTLLEAFPPSPPSRPQWVLATAEADCNLRLFMMRNGRALRQGEAIMARGIGNQILQGINHMHYHLVLHRDLKPDNVLVFFDLAMCSPAPSPENLTAAVMDGANTWKVRVQIADFSRARKLPKNRMSSKGQLRSTVADMSVMICTRNYAAPELLAEDYEAKKSYGAGVDLWSFGCIFFELVVDEVFAPGRNCLEITAWWQLRLGRKLPEPLCVELGIDLTRVERSAAQICTRAGRPADELGLGTVKADPWLWRTLIYEAKDRWTAHALLGDLLLPRQVGLQPPSGPAPSRGREAHLETRAPLPLPAPEAAASIAGSAATSWSTASARAVGSTATARVTFKGVCRCTGNCIRRNEHRRDIVRSGCTNDEVHQACLLCDECKCKVPTCFRPGSRSVYCILHLRVHQAAEWPLQAAIAMGTLAELLLPADVTDLREHASEKHGQDLATMVAIALIKEPSVTAALTRSGCLAAMANEDCSATEVAAMMSDVLNNNELQKASECSELGAQGVCRFTGLASTFRRLGIIKPVEFSDSSGKRKKRKRPSSPRARRAEEDDPEIVHLGVQGRQYAKTGDASTLERFLKACRAQQGTWTCVLKESSIERVVEEIDRMMTSVATVSQIFALDKGGYVRKFIARKLLMVCLWEGALDTTRIWSQISVEKLQRVMPDQTGYLTPIPRNWSCEELSYFVFGRGDMVLYVSMYACLWKSVQRGTTPQQQSVLVTSAMSGGSESEVGKQAQALFAETGHQCTMMTIVARMIQNGKLKL